MRVSVIIPCYNEEDAIAEVVERVKNVDVGFEKEILVIDDYSTDSTAHVANQTKGIKVSARYRV